MPTNQLNNPAGAFGQTPNYPVQTVICLNADASTITPGTLVKIAASNNATAPTGMIPAVKIATTTVSDDALLMGFALETIPVGQSGQIAVGGIISSVADSAINPGTALMNSTVTAGRVQIQPTIAAGNQIGFCLNTPSAAGSPAVVFIQKF